MRIEIRYCSINITCYYSIVYSIGFYHEIESHKNQEITTLVYMAFQKRITQ